MKVHQFDGQHSILNRFLSELRDQQIQKDAMRFRRNVARIGEILSYEMSKTLPYSSQSVKTPLGDQKIMLPEAPPVICSILRAGLPLHQGILNYFDKAESAFISAFRHHPNNDDNFEVVVNYLAAPDLEGKTLLLADPMLATGRTLENVYKVLQRHGAPSSIHIVSVIGSREGVAYVSNIFPEDTHLWIAAVDPELNDKGYIVPGLGDAGDLSYGPKL